MIDSCLSLPSLLEYSSLLFGGCNQWIGLRNNYQSLQVNSDQVALMNHM